jgi:putative membrane protein
LHPEQSACLDRRGSLLLVGILLIGSLASGVGSAYPTNSWLQVGPVILFALALPWVAKHARLSATAWCWIVAFLLLHLFAAHWTYSDVPYSRWLSSIGIDTEAIVGSDRNMFDRLVHFAFGWMAVRPVTEIEERWAGLSSRSARRVAILFVLAASALYEIFEWSLAMVMSPESAEAYNGQQGDQFDAQKDMLLAFLGAIIALILSRTRLQKAA